MNGIECKWNLTALQVSNEWNGTQLTGKMPISSYQHVTSRSLHILQEAV